MSFVFRTKASLEDAVTDTLWQLGCTGITEDKEEILAYFNDKLELSLEGVWSEVNADGYVEAYYASLQPVFLQHLVIAPTHLPVTLSATQRALWLDPGMAFGTGHHETTKMILEALEQLDLFGKTVLDVGAGSGILAIAADLLGAKRTWGVDIDELTLAVAFENAKLNHSRASFELGTLDNVHDSCDVLLANLFAELHVQLAADYPKHLNAGGLVLLSGIMTEKLESVKTALSPFFSDIQVKHDGEWSFVSAVKV